MAVYVSLPQIPVALRFDEPFDEVTERFRSMIENGEVHTFENEPGTSVVVNFAVQASAFVSEGHSKTDPGDIHRAIPSVLPTAPE